MADTKEKLRRDVATVNEYARENMIAMHIEDYVAMRQVCAALSDALNAATPPADAALADDPDWLIAAELSFHKGQVYIKGSAIHHLQTACAEYRKAAVALRARPQAVPKHINAVYFDVPAQPRSAYVMGWNDCIDSMLAASQSATGAK